MLTETAVLIDDIGSGKLFAAVGEPVNQRFGPDTLPVENWKKASRHAASVDWENIRIRARNELTGYLAKEHPAEYQRWNEIVDEVKPPLQRLLVSSLEPKIAEEAVRKPVHHSALWDLLSLMMESEYSHLVRPQFYAALGLVYLGGHYPCGWQGEYPDGKLLIY